MAYRCYEDQYFDVLNYSSGISCFEDIKFEVEA